MSLRDDITNAIKGCPDIQFEFVRLHRYQAILDQIAERFLKCGSKGLNSNWLWNELRNETSNSQPQDVFSVLVQRLHLDERYWFVASEENGKYWLAQATGGGITLLLQEMYCFEYYILDQAMTWMLCENHHGMLIEAEATSPPASR